MGGTPVGDPASVSPVYASRGPHGQTGPKQEPGLMPVPSPQQIQYLGSLEGQELTIQKQANMGVPEGMPMGPQGAPMGGPMHPMHHHPQGMLQGHPSEIPPLDMGPSLTSENSQGSYQSSCSSGMEGTAPRMGGPPPEGGPRFPSPPVPFDGRFAGGMAPHEAFGYMDPRCRPGGVDADHFPHQGGAFAGGPHHGVGSRGPQQDFDAFPPRPGFAGGGELPPSPHIQSLQKMTPPFEPGGKGEDPLNGPHRNSPGCLTSLDASHMGQARPYPVAVGPARGSPGPRAVRTRGVPAFAGNPNVQVKASAPNTIQYLPARPQNPVAAPPHRAPSLDFLQRFATPLTNLDAKVPTQNLQYFPPSGPPQQRAMVMMRGPYPGYGPNGPHPPQQQQPQHHPMAFPGKGPGSPGGGDVVSQPLPPTVGQAFGSYKQGPFYGPTTADPNYAVQFHNFQQQLYATNTRSQQGASSAAAAGPASGFFGPK